MDEFRRPVQYRSKVNVYAQSGIAAQLLSWKKGNTSISVPHGKLYLLYNVAVTRCFHAVHMIDE